MTAGRYVQVVRHADALSRSTWTASDEERPLSLKGERQAEALAEALVVVRPVRAVSSPALRCVATLDPLRVRLGIDLARTDILGEGSPPGLALDFLLDEVADLGEGPDQLGPEGRSLLACTHGNVLDGLVRLLDRRGTVLSFGRPGLSHLRETPKAGRWTLLVDDGVVAEACLVDPPGGTAR